MADAGPSGPPSRTEAGGWRAGWIWCGIHSLQVSAIACSSRTRTIGREATVVWSRSRSVSISTGGASPSVAVGSVDSGRALAMDGNAASICPRPGLSSSSRMRGWSRATNAPATLGPAPGECLHGRTRWRKNGGTNGTPGPRRRRRDLPCSWPSSPGRRTRRLAL